jgi:hypothetical protein
VAVSFIQKLPFATVCQLVLTDSQLPLHFAPLQWF